MGNIVSRLAKWIKSCQEKTLRMAEINWLQVQRSCKKGKVKEANKESKERK